MIDFDLLTMVFPTLIFKLLASLCMNFKVKYLDFLRIVQTWDFFSLILIPQLRLYLQRFTEYFSITSTALMRLMLEDEINVSLIGLCLSRYQGSRHRFRWFIFYVKSSCLDIEEVAQITAYCVSCSKLLVRKNIFDVTMLTHIEYRRSLRNFSESW